MKTSGEVQFPLVPGCASLAFAWSYPNNYDLRVTTWLQDRDRDFRLCALWSSQGAWLLPGDEDAGQERAARLPVQREAPSQSSESDMRRAPGGLDLPTPPNAYFVPKFACALSWSDCLSRKPRLDPQRSRFEHLSRTDLQFLEYKLTK